VQRQKTEHNYINILKESLQEKKKCLNQLLAINKEFEELVSCEDMNYDLFDKNMEAKNEVIKKLENLDDGFVSVYNRVNELLVNDKDTYAEDIRLLKEDIREVTDLTVKLEVSEKKNKDAFDNRMGVMENKIKAGRTGNKVAINYYQNMTKQKVIEPQFMDKKK